MQFGDRPKTRVGNRRRQSGEPGGSIGVQTGIDEDLVDAMIADIVEAQGRCRAYGMLQLKIPFQVGRVPGLLLRAIKQGGEETGSVATRSANVAPCENPLRNVLFDVLALEKMLSATSGKISRHVKELTLGELRANPCRDCCGIKSRKFPIPPRSTVVVLPKGDHAKPKRGSMAMGVAL